MCLRIMNLLGLCYLFTSLEVFAQKSEDSLYRFSRTYIVVLDPGHGGKDAGCIGYSGSHEKDVTLAISLLVGEMLKDSLENVKVMYTRTSDRFVELYRRARLANDVGADLFVSIHCNASESHQAYGTETYVMGLHRTEANLRVAMRENEVILRETNYQEHYGDFDPHSPEAYIIFSLYQHAFLRQSIELANLVEQEFVRKGRKSRGVKQAGFLVLYKTTMPSILVETGFLTHPEEEKYLTSPEGQRETAHAIFRAIVRYLRTVDSLHQIHQQEVDWKTGVREVSRLSPGYYVQFYASRERRDLQQAPFRQLIRKYPVVIWLPSGKGGWFRYLLGPFSTREEALRVKESLSPKHFPDAFVRHVP